MPKKLHLTLLNHFLQESCKYSLNIGLRGGVYVITCGHYLHFDCFIEFMSQENQEVSRLTLLLRLKIFYLNSF